MFSIIISEKGGAERRESFDKAEINVGRVQGNDLVLPKGNVSKHHARLLFRDGRFIVTDLKSTNGTYVNGRKIAQATIVREGDKVYIGDFVIRVDPGAAVEDAPVPNLSGQPEQDVPTMSRDNPIRLANQGIQGTAQGLGQSGAGPAAPPPREAGPPPTMHAQSRPGTAPPRQSQPSSPPGALPSGGPPNMPPLPIPTAGGPLGAAQLGGAGQLGGPTHDFALPRAEFDTAGTPQPPLGGAAAGTADPPPVKRSVPPRAQTMPLDQKVPRPGSLSPLTPEPRKVAPPPIPPVPAEASAPPQPVRSVPPPPVRQEPSAGPPPAMLQATRAVRDDVVGPAVPAPSALSKDKGAHAGRRLALLSLMTRIGDSVDATRLPARVDPKEVARIERAVRDQASQMRNAGDVPEGIDVDALVQDAMSELVSMGPLTSLLDDDSVTEIHCVRYDQILVRRGSELENYELAFSSDDAVRRIVLRLADEVGQPAQPGETPIERRTSRGAHLVAMLPPSAHACAFSIQKRRILDRALEELVRQNRLSRPMATFLEACMAARANLLVCGSSGGPEIVAALASSAQGGARACVAHDADEIYLAQRHVVSVAPNAAAVHGATRLRPDRLLVLSGANGALAAAVDAIASGVSGVVASVPASSIRQGVSRIVSQWLGAHPGSGSDGAKESVTEAFDLVLELAPGAADGHKLPRVTRIAELAGSDAKGVVTRDIFTFLSEGGAEGTFAATGVVPRLATDLAAQGVKLDPALFKRR